MAFVGAVVAICYVYTQLEKENVLFSDFLQTVFLGGIGLFLGSKLLFAITKIPWLIENFSLKNLLLLIPQSGFVFYGGLFGFIFAVCIKYKCRAEERKKMFELMTPAFLLFHMFGRIGCFLSGCCYGKELKIPFHILSFEIDRIPVQLLESMVELILFVLLCAMKRKNKETDYLAVYLSLYAAARFGLEFLRGDEMRGLLAGLSTSQYISMLIILYYVGKKCFSKPVQVKVVENDSEADIEEII